MKLITRIHRYQSFIFVNIFVQVMNESMNKENGRIHRQRPLGNYSSYGNQIYEAFILVNLLLEQIPLNCAFYLTLKENLILKVDIKSTIFFCGVLSLSDL